MTDLTKLEKLLPQCLVLRYHDGTEKAFIGDEAASEMARSVEWRSGKWMALGPKSAELIARLRLAEELMAEVVRLVASKHEAKSLILNDLESICERWEAR